MNGIKLFALMLFSSNAFAAEQTAKQYMGEINGQISIDAEGKVTAVDLDNVKESSLKSLLISQINKWKFYPMQVNGKPVESTSGFSFELTINTDVAKKLNQITFHRVFVSPTPVELAQRLRNVDTSKRVQPEYPFVALRDRLEARLSIAVKIDPDGSVSEAGVYKMKLLNPKPYISDADQRNAISIFGNSAIRAVKQWRFSKERLVFNNCTNGCISRIDVDYHFENKPWNLYREMPVAVLPWVENNNLKKIQDKPESQFVRLKSELSDQPMDIGG